MLLKKGTRQNAKQRFSCYNVILTFLGFAVFYANTETISAETLHYPSELVSAQWQVEPSVFGCNLNQTIPDFGEAQFYHQAGERMVFRLMAKKNLLAVGTAELLSRPPPWMHNSRDKHLAVVAVTAGPVPLVLAQAQAHALMAELRNGRMPVLTSSTYFDEEQLISVPLSPVGFAAAYRAYRSCQANLLPVNFGQIARTSIRWPENSSQLNAAARQSLDNIVLYSKADPGIYGFEVDGFTDTAGDRMENLRLSEQRAFLVTNYLVSQGVDSSKIITRAHGEREEYLLVRQEKNAADRNRNRRVNVVVLKR